jgi:8-oxo-dGTP diphosphatase
MMERGETRVAMDLVVFGLVEGELSVLMGRRPHAPYEDFWALPGEFRHSGQSVDELSREVLERTTGVERAWVEQLATFDRPPVVDEDGVVSTPGRDPRGEIVSVAYMAVVGADRVREDYGGDLGWQAVRRLPGRVAFDHREILDYAVRRLQSKLGYSSLGFELLAEEFTLPELQHVYEAVLGVALNRGNFRRKVLEAGVVEDTGKTRPARGKPAHLYRFRRRAFGLFETPDGFIEG